MFTYVNRSTSLSTDPLVRDAVKVAHQASVNAAVEYFESHLTVRRKAGGIQTEHICGLLGVAVMHQTSSAGDPHLHSHMIFRALAPSKVDGAWRTLDSRVYFATQQEAAAIYHATLVKELTNRFVNLEFIHGMIGSVVAMDAAVPDYVRLKMSKAQAHMLKIAATEGVTLGNNLESDRRIWRLHRQNRQDIKPEALEHILDTQLVVDPTEIISVWRDLADDTSFIDNLQLRDEKDKAEINEPEKDDDLMEALDSFIATFGRFTIPSCIAFLMSSGIEEIRARIIVSIWFELGVVASENILVPARCKTPLKVLIQEILQPGVSGNTENFHSVYAPHSRFIARTAFDAETNIRTIASRLAQKQLKQPEIPPPEDVALSTEQQDTLDLLSKGRQLTAIAGVAGAGKTTVLTPVVEDLKNRDEPILVVARNALLARTLANDLKVGPGTTIAALRSKGHLPNNATIICDEAGVLDLDDFTWLLTEAEATNCRLILA